jgi:hypothetical protein
MNNNKVCEELFDDMDHIENDTSNNSLLPRERLYRVFT